MVFGGGGGTVLTFLSHHPYNVLTHQKKEAYTLIKRKWHCEVGSSMSSEARTHRILLDGSRSKIYRQSLWSLKKARGRLCFLEVRPLSSKLASDIAAVRLRQNGKNIFFSGSKDCPQIFRIRRRENDTWKSLVGTSILTLPLSTLFQPK